MLDKGVCQRPFPSGLFQGFVTEGGNFVDRMLAMRIALDAGQVEDGKQCGGNKRELFSEDLIHSEIWDYPYTDRYERT